MIGLPLLNPECRTEDVAAELAVDMPGLGLSAGQVVTIRPADKADCDAVFAFADGSLARLQHWSRCTFRKTDMAGAVQIVAAEALGQVAGRVIARRAVQP